MNLKEGNPNLLISENSTNWTNTAVDSIIPENKLLHAWFTHQAAGWFPSQRCTSIMLQGWFELSLEVQVTSVTLDILSHYSESYFVTRLSNNPWPYPISNPSWQLQLQNVRRKLPGDTIDSQDQITDRALSRSSSLCTPGWGCEWVQSWDSSWAS